MRRFLYACGAVLCFVLFAALLVYRWNHEAVRLYDAPPIRSPF